jgi:hypothetical protein
MAWDGYYVYGGDEIINVARTEAYVKAGGHSWFRPAFNNAALPDLLGDGKYTNPLNDDPPWFDPDDLSSTDFYGFYPFGITGIDDSTRTASPTEALGDGGVPGRVRNAMRSMVFSGVLLAGSECGAEYGMRWLRDVLSGSPCGSGPTSVCDGFTLCYLSCEPDVEEAPQVLVQAVMDGGFCTDGTPVAPLVYDGAGPANEPGEQQLDGGAVPDALTDVVDGGTPAYHSVDAEGVEMVQVDEPDCDGGGVSPKVSYYYDGGTAATTLPIYDASTIYYPFSSLADPTPWDATDCLGPYLRTLHQVVVTNGPVVDTKRVMSDGGAVWNVQFTALAGNPAQFGEEVPVIEGFLDPAIEVPWAGGVVPEGAMIDLDGFIAAETACDSTDPGAIFDPLFPATILPPAPPNVPLGNYQPPTNWHRRQFTIPKTYVPLWGDVVPTVYVHARTADVRNLRLRFYADPYVLGDISDDPCSYCGDIVVSYVPQDHTLVLDGCEQIVYVVTPGGVRRRADSLVFKTDGTPFEWPSLSCGFGYVVTVDLPQTQEPPVVDLSLYPRAV